MPSLGVSDMASSVRSHFEQSVRAGFDSVLASHPNGNSSRAQSLEALQHLTTGSMAVAAN